MWRVSIPLLFGISDYPVGTFKLLFDIEISLSTCKQYCTGDVILCEGKLSSQIKSHENFAHNVIF